MLDQHNSAASGLPARSAAPQNLQAEQSVLGAIQLLGIDALTATQARS